jgi:hypothetical protein
MVAAGELGAHVAYRIVADKPHAPYLRVERRLADARWVAVGTPCVDAEQATARMRYEMARDRLAASRLGVDVWTEVEGSIMEIEVRR